MPYMSFSLSELLNFDPKIANDMSLSEKLENILTTAVGGYLLVFVVLALIWMLLEIFGKLISGKKPKEEKASVSEPVPEPAPEPVTEVIEEAPSYYEEDELEIIAAITAAISAYDDKPVGSFRVVSFRKKN